MCVLKDRYAHTNEYVSESPSVSIIPVRQFFLSVVWIFQAVPDIFFFLLCSLFTWTDTLLVALCIGLTLKTLFEFSCNILWTTLKKVFGQPDRKAVCQAVTCINISWFFFFFFLMSLSFWILFSDYLIIFQALHRLCGLSLEQPPRALFT